MYTIVSYTQIFCVLLCVILQSVYAVETVHAQTALLLYYVLMLPVLPAVAFLLLHVRPVVAARSLRR